MAVCPQWRDTSALCAAARVRDRPAPCPARYTSLQALLRVHNPCLAEEKLRFLCAANANRTGGRMSGRRKPT